MERHCFICSSCGAEFWLQAWKSICPSCKSEYTLVRREVKQPTKWVLNSHFIAAFTIAIYVLYSIVFPQSFSLYLYLQPSPPIILQALTFVLAVFVFSGSLPALVASVAFGTALVILHLPRMVVGDIFGALAGAFIVVSSLTYIRYLHAVKKHISKDVDAKSMPEYSGWAGYSTNL